MIQLCALKNVICMLSVWDLEKEQPDVSVSMDLKGMDKTAQVCYIPIN